VSTFSSRSSADDCARDPQVIHIDAKPTVRKQIVRELHIMHECHSPYIVSFYGAFLNEGDVVMCMEYMDCGYVHPLFHSVLWRN
jgi:serine/threonine protein kinase